MTDNGCPVEISWNWGWDGQSPSVRYAFEPLSHPYPSPLRKQNPGLDFISALSASSNIDTKLFNHFWGALTVPEHLAQSSWSSIEGHSSQFFAGYDIEDTSVVPKAYFMPGAKAQMTSQTKYALVRNSLRDSPAYPLIAPSFKLLDRFIMTSALARHINAEIFSFDVKPPETTRYKIYLRCLRTSFESVRTMVTLGGLIRDDKLEQSIERLRRLWLDLFRPDHPCEQCPLTESAHRTAGILYYYEFVPGREFFP
ncbi:MAG: hypothetical protein M1828_001508 [Chrysothrix sp. TS-e1954]|nr:MAG: hypothetical protein M1828_001508 [Chrysothrix sp. TS-e1954]